MRSSGYLHAYLAEEIFAFLQMKRRDSASSHLPSSRLQRLFTIASSRNEREPRVKSSLERELLFGAFEGAHLSAVTSPARLAPEIDSLGRETCRDVWRESYSLTMSMNLGSSTDTLSRVVRGQRQHLTALALTRRRMAIFQPTGGCSRHFK